jgi:hypothetical protein
MKNPNAVALGRLGGSKGGEARRDALTPARRLEISQKASRAAAAVHRARAKARRKANGGAAEPQK